MSSIFIVIHTQDLFPTKGMSKFWIGKVIF